VLIGADGRVREVFVKDLLDMMHDPAAESAAGHTPRAVPVLRDREWHNIGEPEGEYGVEAFYTAYLGQTRYPVEAERGRSAFHEAIRDEIVALARARLPRSAERYPEHRALFREKRSLAQTLHALRELQVKTGIERGFRADPSAARWIDGRHGGTPVYSPLKIKPDESWIYGYVGQVPVAVKAQANGVIDDYHFRFE
jgi:hypothetical protein